MARHTLTYGSLFTGIGGFDLGLDRAGMICKWQSETNDYCVRVLSKHWPHVQRYGDIREIDFEQIEKVDVICGGFPCQPVSGAGKRLVQADPRWLWPEFARAIRALRPSYIAVENVPGLLVRGLGDVLSDLAALGYDAEWQVLSAAALGAPHLRERVFIIAYADGRGVGQQHVQSQIRLDQAGQNQNVADANSRRRQRKNHEPPSERALFERTDFARSRAQGLAWWSLEPGVGRMAYGVPKHVDRLRTLGNAVIPQAAEFVGTCIVNHFHSRQCRQ